MDKFKIGEVVDIFQANKVPDAVGREATILGIKRTFSRDYYELEVSGMPSIIEGHNWLAPEECLKKKKPPEELTTWEKVKKATGWQPESLVSV